MKDCKKNNKKARLPFNNNQKIFGTKDYKTNKAEFQINNNQVFGTKDYKKKKAEFPIYNNQVDNLIKEV